MVMPTQRAERADIGTDRESSASVSVGWPRHVAVEIVSIHAGFCPFPRECVKTVVGRRARGGSRRQKTMLASETMALMTRRKRAGLVA